VSKNINMHSMLLTCSTAQAADRSTISKKGEEHNIYSATKSAVQRQQLTEVKEAMQTCLCTRRHQAMLRFAHRPAEMLSAKRFLSTATAVSPSLAFTAKQMLCSLLAWLIMITFTPASRTVLNTALAIPAGS
jgi:hypothetical protein